MSDRDTAMGRGSTGNVESPAGLTLGRRTFIGLGASLGAGAMLAACGVPTAKSGSGSSSSASGGGGTLNALFMQQAGYSSSDVNAMTKAFERANPGVTVKNTFVAYEALHDKIVISAPAGTYDVVLIDCIWPAELASKNMILDVTSRYPKKWYSDILPGTLSTVTYKNRRYGIPWTPGGKVFFYNKALLAEAGVPESQMTSWDGCVSAAKTLKAKGIVKYPFIWSWAQAEAMICDYTQLLGAFGGSFLDGSGQPAWNTGGGVKALEWMVQTLNEGLSNPASTKSLEDDVKKSLLQNQAAMGLNWDYVYAASHDPKEAAHPGQLVVTTSPKGPNGKNPSCDGGMGLSVTAGSKQPDLAWKLCSFLASPQQQMAHADNTLPIWKSAYTSQLAQGREQLVQADQRTYANLISRPEVPNYNAVSQVLQQELQAALLGQKSPQAALNSAADQAKSILAS